MNATRYTAAEVSPSLRAALLAYAAFYESNGQDEETLTGNLTLELNTEAWSAEFGMISQTEGCVEIFVDDGRYFSIQAAKGLIETVTEEA